MPDSNTDNNHLYIDTAEELAAFCRQLSGVRVLAVDTEFIREKTYYSQLCLIQIAGNDLIACIDPISIGNIDPLLDLLYDNDIIKVLHAARQDLEIFYNLRGKVPAPVFDTQIAAAVLGHGEQVGYSKLVEDVLHVQLHKGYARTDWSKRPLSREQLLYAADDVRYLIRLYPLLRQQLDALGRADWLEEDFAALSENALYEIDPETVWQRISGRQRLNGQRLAILHHLAKWREELAIQLDRPRKWVLADDLLIALAQQGPDTAAQLQSLRGLPPRVLEKHRQDILAQIAAAKKLPKEQWPQDTKPMRTTPEQDALADGLMSLLRLRAAEYDIAPTTLATRKDIDKLALGERDIPLLHGWRAQVAGHDLLKLLEGKIVLQVVNGQVTGVNATPN
ncbi:MAG: ribonuclease D [Gammaproteobacteria bacterium]|nr:ribonuclease D [Gammaproteobacteria bacterium]